MRGPSMRSERGQIQIERRLVETSIACPEPRPDRETGRGKQVKIDIADSDAEQSLVVEKSHHLDMLRQRYLWQGLQRADRLIPVIQAAQRDFRDDVWVHEDFTFFEQ